MPGGIQSNGVGRPARPLKSVGEGGRAQRVVQLHLCSVLQAWVGLAGPLTAAEQAEGDREELVVQESSVNREDRQQEDYISTCIKGNG